MNSSRYIPILVGVLLFAGCASPSRAPRAWEYKRITIEQGKFVQELNRLGTDGWEVVDHTGHQGSHVVVFLKRPHQ